ncbi:MAG: histidine kinase, partial [Parabacteroides sp.]|nr:histidine kinase [Parabacteroides sp.]
TLNNIHALVDINPEQAKETVLELSKMMRYVLYESNKRTVSLWQEIDFLQHYIKLMKLRYTDRLELIVSIHKEELPPAQVPPLLLITFVENAFKHGVSYQEPSFIHITMDVCDGKLRYLVVNSCHKSPEGEAHGIGLENVRKRLQLIYDQQSTLDIQQRADEYQVLLLIPLQL